MHELDARGLSCPLPLLKAKQQLNRMAGGESLRVLATDPGSVRDFRVFCEQSGHVLESQQVHAGAAGETVYDHVIRKMAPPG